VKAALGLDITKEELGGAALHTQRSGVADNLAETEEDALRQVRAFLSYLPGSVAELPPRAAPAEPAIPAEQLRAVVPESRRQPFDVYAILGAALDAGSFFEIAPRYGPSRVTGLGRVDGFPVGVMANNPRRPRRPGRTAGSGKQAASGPAGDAGPDGLLGLRPRPQPRLRHADQPGTVDRAGRRGPPPQDPRFRDRVRPARGYLREDSAR
jgi:acetyl-CoA carboxylase carboxyltransferase component